MVDDKDNPVVSQASAPAPPWEIPLLLLGAFRSLVDDAHLLLADRGHADVRPAFGFALQAIGSGATATEVGARLGVSKQAAAKTIEALEARGYVERSSDPADSRRKLIRPTERGHHLLTASVEAFEQVVARWSALVGPAEIEQLHDTLTRLGVSASAHLDLGSWSA